MIRYKYYCKAISRRRHLHCGCWGGSGLGMLLPRGRGVGARDLGAPPLAGWKGCPHLHLRRAVPAVCTVTAVVRSVRPLNLPWKDVWCFSSASLLCVIAWGSPQILT